MKKNTIYVLALILLIGSTLIGFPAFIKLQTIQQGFEGAKCYFYGADFRFNPEWDGTYELHRYQDAEDPLVLGQHTEGWRWIAEATITDRVYWSTVATPNDAGIGWREDAVWRGGTATREHPFLGVHIESNIALEDLTRQGDPLGWNDTDPTTARRIEYWTKNIEKIEETDEKVVYRYTYSKESFLIAPAEFWIGFYLVPSQDDAQTDSGWREGEWNNIVVWLMLDWNVWDNAYKDPWLDDPQVNVFESLYEGEILNKQRLSEYRGGFPITGWIQGWEKAGWHKYSWEEGAISDPNAESPRWLQTRGSENNIYTPEELADLKDKLMTKCRFSPELIGQFISLYDQPSAKFEYEMPASMYESTDFSDPKRLSNYVKAPDSRMKKTMYFPINILNFGTYTEVSGPFYGKSYRVFYPSAYFRVRMIYGVYGNFTYLWTESVKKQPEIDYPDEIERHGTTVIHVKGAGEWWAELLTNPWTWAWIIVIIVILGIIFIGPALGSWLMLSLRRKGR